MRINHNIAALNTYRQLNSASGAQAKSMEKLSSGLRINNASDDAAGLAISEKMRGQIRGLDMASKNAQDGISLIQTAEGALNETHDILQRMRELAVQSSNDTNTDTDREEIQKEIGQLVQEIDRISTDTEFNSKSLLNGNSGFSASVDASTGMTVLSGGNAAAGTIQLTGITSAKQAEFKVGSFADTGDTSNAMTVANGATFQINGESITTTAGTTANLVSVINEKTAETGVTAKMDGNNLVLTSASSGSATQIKVDGLDSVLTAAASSTLSVTTDGSTLEGTDATTLGASMTASGIDATATEAASSLNGGQITASGNTITIVGGDFDGMKLNVANNVSGGSGNIEVESNNSLTLQIGANQTQTMSIAINDMSSSALQISGIDVSTSAGAQSAITDIQKAIETVSAERSKLGAYQNRLDHTINNLGTSSENLTAAESRIRDVDMAKEMMNQTKNSILSQAAQAMLAQANQQPQGVLQLLR